MWSSDCNEIIGTCKQNTDKFWDQCIALCLKLVNSVYIYIGPSAYMEEEHIRDNYNSFFYMQISKQWNIILWYFFYDKGKRVAICQGDRQTISCKKNRRLQIMTATYGLRRTRNKCRNANRAVSWCGKTNNAKTKVIQLCQSKQDCELFSSNRVFRDPCPGTSVILTVVFRCVRGKILLLVLLMLIFWKGCCGDVFPGHPLKFYMLGGDNEKKILRTILEFLTST